MTAEREPLPQGTGPRGLRSAAPSRAGMSPSRRFVAEDAAAEPDEEARRCLELLRRSQKGDIDAFRELIQATQGRVFRVVRSVVHCDRAAAEDLVQETFVRVWKALPRFQGERALPWIHTVATNVAITEWRHRRAEKRAKKTLSIDATIAGTDDLTIEPVSRERRPDDLSGQREFGARVRDAVLQLPDEFRLPVVLRDLEGMSYEEVAEALSLPGGTVRSRIHRGRCMLQQLLQGFLP